MKNNTLSLLVSFFLFSCTQKAHVNYVTYRTVEYETETKHQAVPISYSFAVPKIISLEQEGAQRQVRGDITITLELLPFITSRYLDSSQQYVPVSHDRYNTMDRIETKYTPRYYISSAEGYKNDNIRFKVTIHNGGERTLKLQDVALTAISDGKLVVIPGENLLEWQTGMILHNYEKSFIIEGPNRNTLGLSKLFNVAIYDVPVQYDQAGNVVKKDNFGWLYDISQEASVTKQDSITYRYHYVPVHSEQCGNCLGRGTVMIKETCGACRGTGLILGTTCYSCKGARTVIKNYKCSECSGRGELYYPKSPEVSVASDDEETWSYSPFKLKVTGTNDIRLWLYDRNEKGYTAKSHYALNYWMNPPHEEYPVMIKCNGKLLQVLPKDQNGNYIRTIAIRYRSGVPEVVKGTISKKDYSNMLTD